LHNGFNRLNDEAISRKSQPSFLDYVIQAERLSIAYPACNGSMHIWPSRPWDQFPAIQKRHDCRPYAFGTLIVNSNLAAINISYFKFYGGKFS